MIEFTFLQRNSPNVFQNYFETPTKMNALKGPKTPNDRTENDSSLSKKHNSLLIVLRINCLMPKFYTQNILSTLNL